MDECCVACLSDNRSSFAGLNEKETVEDFLSEKLPFVFANYPVILCSACMFQLEKFRNFRRFVQNSISTLTKQLNKIYSCRVFVEPIAIFLIESPYTIKNENVDSAECDAEETHHQNEDSDYEMEDVPTDSVSSFDRKRVKKVTPSAKVRERKGNNYRLQKEKHQESNKKENKSNGTSLEEEPNRESSIKIKTSLSLNYDSSLDQWESEIVSATSKNKKHKKGTKKYKYAAPKAAKWNEYIEKHKNKLPSLKVVKHGEGEKSSSFQCDHCPYTSNRKNNMLKHLKIHFNIKSFKCHFCSQSFSSGNNCKEHVMAHYTPKALICDFCSKSFSSRAGLQDHIQGKHLNVKFSCDECQKEFDSRSAFSRHKRVHSKTMAYVCNLCPAKFRWKNNFMRHLELHERRKEIKLSIYQ